MRVSAVVRPHHIRGGERASNQTCAMALCLQELGFEEVRVKTRITEAVIDGVLHFAKNSKRACEFISQFDAAGSTIAGRKAAVKAPEPATFRFDFYDSFPTW